MTKNSNSWYIVILAIIIIGFPILARGKAIDESLKLVSSSNDFVEMTVMAGLSIDLRYATPNNFVGKNIYGDFNKVFLHKIAAEKMEHAVKALQSRYPQYRLVIFDALRPRSVQYVLWDQVKGTEKQKYVANPKGGSIHNYGFAVDLSILDETGKELDMGTPYDDFSALAQPQLEDTFLKEGKLNKVQIHNREILRGVMEEAGFIQLPLEWWHFDALPKNEVKTKFKIID